MSEYFRESERSRVALVSCSSYQPEVVAGAFAEGLRLLGGIENILGGKKSVLLKPNLLHGDDPARGSTTHPAVLRAAALAFRGAGYRVAYGDSPAFHQPKTAVRASGYEAAAAETGMTLADFVNGEEKAFPAGRQNKLFYIARGVLEAEAVVNLPKMKTHGLTGMSGALKNMFGVIPGLRKAWFHARLPDEQSFSRMLIDLNRFITPALSVMDAVLGMEGNGPRNGRLVPTNLLILSTDPVALDATACRIMGMRAERIYFLTYAASAGLGKIAENAIEIVGMPLAKAVGKPYALHPPNIPVYSSSSIQKYIKRFIVPRPVIDRARCTHCLQCVRICPVDPKALMPHGTSPPRFDYNRCIRCYCCQETCPEGAIGIRVPLPGVIFHGFKKRF